MTTKRCVAVVAVMVLALVALVAVACYPPQPVDDGLARAVDPNILCYREQGGDKLICVSGGEFEVQSGAGLDVQAGATVVFATPPAIAGDYPLENAVGGKEFAFGSISNVMVATVAPTMHALSTVTAYGCDVKSPELSKGWSCGAQLGASNQITITVYEYDATPVPTASVKNVSWWAAGN